MQWDQETRAAIDVALNEAEVLGLRPGPHGAWCDLLLHVPALPVTGLYGAFSDLGELERHVIDSSAQAPEQTAAELTAALGGGRFTIRATGRER
jgi:hypothetical protein